ncbi:ribonuclease 1 [Cryptomeria japonica]|uniref:ribonuclease 1 n=1 Tax=Cryptomeria japonica TaxID=3369 RepID=UPI0025AD3AA3|nr:ribonuclease 1 [Cryptomeria japonica]
MESITKTMSVFALFFLCTTFCFTAKAQNFDFFYLVQQWPGSYCDTSNGCCYPSTGKPASDFSIHGLWPNYDDGTYPSNCDNNSPFDPSQISDLRNEMSSKWESLACPSSNGQQFWQHEWEKHGTCSENVLSQHDYFAAALRLKDSVDVLGALENAGIQPDGGQYSVSSITNALKKGTGYTAGIECNTDESGNKQLYQIYLCVDSSGSNFMNCPVLPQGKCSSSDSQVEFPSF